MEMPRSGITFLKTRDLLETTAFYSGIFRIRTGVGPAKMPHISRLSGLLSWLLPHRGGYGQRGGDPDL